MFLLVFIVSSAIGELLTTHGSLGYSPNTDQTFLHIFLVLVSVVNKERFGSEVLAAVLQITGVTSLKKKI